jgi:penicillin-binding protein 2
MWFIRLKRLWQGRRQGGREIDPDEILIDGVNLPDFDVHQFEGRLERPIASRAIIVVGLLFFCVTGLYAAKAWTLEIRDGAVYQAKSENNRLRHTQIFASRGVIYDRNEKLIAWNVPNPDDPDFALRKYADLPGLSNIVGYLKYPSKDASGFYYREDFVGLDGVEEAYHETLGGENGLKITETDALDNIQSESVIRRPKDGDNVRLSIDAEVQSALYRLIADTADRVGFTGGAGVLMDVETGELIALTTYPEYDSQTLSDGTDKAKINRLLSDRRKPFLNRATAGLYTPGSIVKLFISLGALNEGVIDPTTQILSTGSISLPNQYDPTKRSVFNDWKAHGWVDMRRALAVSSNVYFFEVGGGFESQRGLGIAGIEKYMRMFGFGSPVPASPFSNASGVIPNPEWKAAHFSDGIWRVGDTYNSSIGQYGFQVTPLQVVRAVSAIATEGVLLPVSIIEGGNKLLPPTVISVPKDLFLVVKEGMRLAVTEGTASTLNTPLASVAGKTGTAELGVSKEFVNSWVTGFFPYERPRYAFTVLMEHGPRRNLIGGAYIIKQFIEWLSINAPEYLSEIPR